MPAVVNVSSDLEEGPSGPVYKVTTWLPGTGGIHGLEEAVDRDLRLLLRKVLELSVGCTALLVSGLRSKVQSKSRSHKGLYYGISGSEEWVQDDILFGSSYVMVGLIPVTADTIDLCVERWSNGHGVAVIPEGCLISSKTLHNAVKASSSYPSGLSYNSDSPVALLDTEDGVIVNGGTFEDRPGLIVYTKRQDLAVKMDQGIRYTFGSLS
ncbi:MAG: hypothetical protein AAGI71_04440 [Bacteroidota bacterium]